MSSGILLKVTTHHFLFQNYVDSIFLEGSKNLWCLDTILFLYNTVYKYLLFVVEMMATSISENIRREPHAFIKIAVD